MLLQLADYYPLLFLAPFLVLALVFRARHYAAPRRWQLRALAVSVAMYVATLGVGLLWGRLLPEWSLIDGAALGTWGGAIAGILVYELAHYWYHRAAHEWDWLWRLGHQMHHSAESLDAFGAYYMHPIDGALFTTWVVLVFYPLLGLAPESAAIAAAFLAFNAAFQHANIRTPRWLGFVVQRPESHAVHHGRGFHRDNYSDLPLWDMLFGTFRNPRAGEVPREAGFYDGASTRIGAMLAFRDVTQPRLAPGPNAGAVPRELETQY
ncbi:MAG: sterol desaturase family protein [Gammaproteobacteria bacterium]|nr:sterol desaturase family protein [Gammaproteobacteria bacterium]